MSNQDKMQEALDKFQQVVAYGQQMRQESLDDIDDGDEELDVVYSTETTQEYADSVGAIPATDEEFAAHGITLIEDDEKDA